MPDEVLRDFLRRVQIFRIATIKVRQREAIQPPRLPAAPLRTEAVSLSAVFLDALACLRVELDNVADRPVRAQELPQRRLRVNLRDFRESRVARLAGCPPEQGKIHHAVDDGESALVRVIPRADEPRRVEAPHEKACRVKRVGFRLFVTGQLCIRAAGQQVHEANVVVQAAERAEFIREELLHAPRFCLELLVARRAVQLPHQPRPEAACPPAVAVVRGCNPSTFFALIRDDARVRRQFCAPAKLVGCLPHGLRVFFHSFSHPF